MSARAVGYETPAAMGGMARGIMVRALCGASAVALALSIAGCSSGSQEGTSSAGDDSTAPVISDAFGESTTATADDEQYTLHFQGFDFVIPEPWRDEVVVDAGTNITRLMYGDFSLLEIFENTTEDMSKWDTVSEYTRADGTKVGVYTFDCEALIMRHPSGAAVFMTSGYFGKGCYKAYDRVAPDMRRLQSLVSGVDPAPENGNELVEGTLLACADYVTFTGGPTTVRVEN